MNSQIQTLPQKLDAQFPGSIKPTVTSSPGPIYLKKKKNVQTAQIAFVVSPFQVFKNILHCVCSIKSVKILK